MGSVRKMIREELERKQARAVRRVIREAAEDAIMIVANTLDQLRGGDQKREQEIIDAAVMELERMYSEPYATGQLPDVMGKTEIDDIGDVLRSVAAQRAKYETDPGSADLDQLARDEKELPMLAADLMQHH